MNETLTEQDFRLQADHALEQTQRSLLPLADQEGFEVELQNGVLQIVFEDPSPAKFVVSPNAPVRQVVFPDRLMVPREAAQTDPRER